MKKLFIITTVILCCIKVHAENLYVPSGQYSTIQSAIDDANHGDTIIVSTGTYQENINFLGNAITVRSTDPNDPNVVDATIIDGSYPTDTNAASVVTFNHGEDTNSVLTGFTITGGTGSWLLVAWQFKGLNWNRCGGGVLCYNMSQPTISKNVFINNTAGQGGGIYIYGYHGNPQDPNEPNNPDVRTAPLITDNTFTNNSAIAEHGFDPPDTNYPNNDHGDGGAIVGFQGIDAVITGNLMENNHADYYGGAIHVRQWSNGLVENNQIIENDSALGAGVHITYNSSPTVAYNLIQANIASGLGGGGIYVIYQSHPLIEQNLITQNESINGAGIIVINSSNPVIRNNLIVNNVNGAGVRIKSDSTPTINHNTIVGNTASPLQGGGVDCITDSAPVIEHNIIALNGTSYGIYASTTPPVIRYNNLWGNGAGNYNALIGDQTAINGNISTDPEFIDANGNDYHLNYSSKCINAGDPNFSSLELTDYDDEPRKIGQFIDIGADEVWPVWNISSTGRYTNIQQAIDDANDGDVIIITLGTHTGTGNRDIDFTGKAITLQSIDPNDFDIVASTVIDCQGSIEEKHRGFNFHSGEDANSILTGFTVTGGGGNYHGAIYCIFSSSPTIKNCIVRNNSMHDHGSGFYCGFNSNPTITNCLITSNTFTVVGYGGGIYCYQSSPTISNCIITNNSAVGHGRHGGAICSWIGSDPLIANCIVAGNSAEHRGGGLYSDFANPTYLNCTVIGNKSMEGGGIGSFELSNPSVINCIVRDNRAPDGNELALINAIRVWGVPCPTDMTVSFSNIKGGQEQVCVDDDCTLYWGDGNIDLDPNFVDAGYWDDANTPTDINDDFFVLGNYHLLPISGCIDMGDNNSVTTTIDTDGEQRIFNSIVDMGADEVVTNPIDLDSDGIVDYNDLAALIDEWLQGVELQTDFYDDDFIDFADFAIFANQWLWKAGWYQ